MHVDMAKENLCVNKIVGQKSQTVEVEGDIIVPDVKPDILNTINTSGNVCVYKKEVLDGKIRIDGDINVYVMYCADSADAETRGLNTTIDFTQVLDFEGIMPEMSLDEKTTVKSIECKVLNGRKINIKAILEFCMSAYSNENVEVIKEVNNVSDIQSLQSNLNINSLLGEGTTKAYAKDTIAIENIDNLAEVLNTNLSVVNKDTKMSYNKVLAKADVLVKVMYLTEDNRIKMVESNIPVMGFIDIDNIDDNNICDMNYKLKNSIIKPNSVEDHSIHVEIEVEIYARVYENKELKIIQDLYSPSEDLAFNKKCINTMSDKCKVKDVCNLKEKVMIPEINGNEIYDVEVKPNILSKNVSNKKVMYEGEVELNFIYAKDNDSGIDSKKTKLPFTFNMDSNNLNSNSNVDTDLEVINNNFIVGADGYIEVNIGIQFELSMSNLITINVIDDIKIEESRDRQIHSMTIYFVKSGDTLWEIAKRFRSTIEDIARVNRIEDENKIYAGQQLFIPRYVNTRNGVSA